jgi:peptidyl-prolyl cis-trans isomerase C
VLKLRLLTSVLAVGLLCATPSALYAQDKNPKPETTPETTPTKQKSDISKLDPSTVLATVNKQDITLKQLQSVLSLLPEEYKTVDEQILINTMLHQFINEALLVEAATNTKLLEKPEVQLLLEAIRRDSISEIYLDRKLKEIITDDYLLKRYETIKEGYTPVQEVKARHILVEDEAKIKDIAQKLKDGASFEELAKEHSMDGTAQNGGDLGWFTKEDMVESFGTAAFALEKDQVSAPVRTPFGWHLIRLDDKRDREFPPFELLKPQLASEAKSRELQKVIDDLRKEASITIKPGFEKLPEEEAYHDEDDHNHGEESLTPPPLEESEKNDE